jgi:zinc finger BED domain-containing protein 1 (E3 SUMO-protein ligase ZBED1)
MCYVLFRVLDQRGAYRIVLQDEINKFKNDPGMPMFQQRDDTGAAEEAPRFNNPLERWEEKEQFYPKLACLARAILQIPATSAPVERLFSTAGVVVNKKRNRLSPQLAGDIIFLKE